MVWSPGWWAAQALAFLARLLNDYAARRRAEAALRDLGAASARLEATAAAEAAERKARQAAERAAADADDPRDLRD